MSGSRTFGKKVPFKNHLNRGSGGVQAEVSKLRDEVDRAFLLLEASGQLALYTISPVAPTSTDDSTQGHTRFSRWLKTTAPAAEYVLLNEGPPGAAFWHETTNSGGGGGGAIDSVFGRTGTVLSAVGDYAASQVTNDSGVAGLTVADALDALDAAVPPPAPVTSVFSRTGAVVAASGDYSSSQVTNLSGVPGALVTDALDSLLSTRAPNSRSLTAGAGLTGGGDLSADRTFNVAAHADGSIVVNANDIQIGSLATDLQHGSRGGGNLHPDATVTVSGFFSAADKVKLNAIEAGAEVNDVASVFGRTGAVTAVLNDYAASLVNNDSAVAGATVADALETIAADFVPDSRQIIAGSGLTGGGDLTVNRTLTVGANPDGSIIVNTTNVQVGVLATDAQHGVRGGGTQHADATITVSGFLSATDKVKLNGIEAGAEVNDVFSVFGRVGAVVAALNDYTATLVDNDSTVVGATVADALDTLLGMVSGGGLTAGSHRTLRQLIHFIDGGPAGGFTTDAYRETLPAADPFPTSVIWWTDSGKTDKIVELTITRDGQQRPTVKLWEMYDTDGSTVIESVSDAIAYSGTTPFELSRTRTIS